MNATRSDDPELVELGTLLAPAYRTLGQLYLDPPDERTVGAIAEWCTAVGDEQATFPEPLQDAFENIEAGAKEDNSQLRGAFTELLQGVGYGASPAPPYESLYVDGVLNGPSSSEVEAFYLEAGVELAVDDELIDHAGYELAFLAELCERGAVEAQRGFIETHIGDWLTEFHGEAAAYDPPLFYQGVFELTGSLLEFHRETIQEGRQR